jgi:hypothetical protein
VCPDWFQKSVNSKEQENPSIEKEFFECGRKDREMNEQDESEGRFSLFLLANLNVVWKSKKIIENFSFLQAALVSVQNTYTHSPSADTCVLYSDRHELNFHTQSQLFWTSFWHCLVSFIVTSIPFPSSHLRPITSYRTHRPSNFDV